MEQHVLSKYLLTILIVTILAACGGGSSGDNDTTPPDTSIMSGPSSLTGFTSAVLSFTTTEGGSLFECRLNGNPFTNCLSPKSYKNLTDGTYRFRVRSIDTAGNIDATAAIYRWKVDTTSPNTNIISAPLSSTNLTSAKFSFTATERGATFECSLNDNPFTDCLSPKSYQDLANNAHRFRVRSTDIAKNTDSTAATYRWIIDLVSPDTNIVSSPLSSTNLTNATFLFDATEDAVSFECSLNYGLYTACRSPVTYRDMVVGSNNFSVRATDASGNTDLTAAVFQWDITPTDPLYSDQWHLKNTGQSGNDNKRGKVGEDINVEPVWNSCTDSSCRGEGIRIAVVDDGLEITHDDLKANTVPGKSYDYIDQDTNPAPEEHGTSVAGIIAALDLNGIGVRGVAPRAELVGYNFLSRQGLVNQSDAMTRDAIQNHVSNNSWGITNGAGTLIDSSAVWRTAINTGHRIGRGGLGTVYVFAAGNGHSMNFFGIPILVDNSNYDGYSNYRGVVAVGAVNNRGKRAYYSERGANLLVSAPGGEDCDAHGIVTTDLTGSAGYNSGRSRKDYFGNANYTGCFGFTSAAAPMVSGVVALVLQANPSLGWRDVHAILARSARKNDPLDVDWQTNGAGLQVNHNYGFGVVDAEAAVSLAKNWINLGMEKKFSTLTESVNEKIGDDDGVPVQSTLSVVASGINNIEFIEITFSANDHTYSGDLEITLTNLATGAISRLAERHLCIPSCVQPYDNWRFGSTRHLGEGADGDWQLTVGDKSIGDRGTFQSWKLTFYGT